MLTRDKSSKDEHKLNYGDKEIMRNVDKLSGNKREYNGRGRGRHRFRCGDGEQTSLEILLSRLANNIRAIIGEKKGRMGHKAKWGIDQ